MSFGARALIKLGALKHNVNVIRTAAPGAKIMAVIKANAYGHGIVAVARNLGGVDALAVARLQEAIELREHGIEMPIVLLAGVYDAGELQTAIDLDLQLVVHSAKQIELLEACPGGALATWLKFDTGMNRLGFPTQHARELIKRVSDVDAVRELRLMTHLSSADEAENEATAAQLGLFRSVVSGFDGDISVANSPGLLGEAQTLAENFATGGNCWVRPGIALFGISPFAGKSSEDLGLKPVMQFEARLIAVKALAAGARVGYAGRYQSPIDTVLGIVSVGYGDGYSRHFRSGTPVLLNARKVGLIGNVSMDMIAVDLGPGASDKVGDIATLWGRGLPVEEVAPWASAIPYELVCGIMNREASEIVD